MEIMIKNQNYKDFIYNSILPCLNYDKLTEDNIDEVYDYIVFNYETTYSEKNDPRLTEILNILNYLEHYMEFA